MNDPTVVMYSVKELLQRVDERLIRIDEKLETKANQAEVVALAEKIANLEGWRQRVIGAAIALGAVAGGVAGRLVQLL